MDLAYALRLAGNGGPDRPPPLAFVGAGGKTTALFRLARELLAGRTAPITGRTPPAQGRPPSAPTVLVSATTHLAVEQLSLADAHFTIRSPLDFETIEESLPPGVVLATGPEVEAGRVAGLEGEALERLHRLAEGRGLPLLLEADGSRRRPLKAPAAHEPALPAWIEQVVVVAGLGGLGLPLDALTVHRPERFAALAGIGPGETITPAALAAVLGHPQGGLKDIPSGAGRCLLLNGAATPERQAQGLTVAEALAGVYPQVLIADLKSLPGEAAGQGEEVLAVCSPVAGIVLAAGRASRFGRPKQLLDWRGEPFVRRVAGAALAGGLDPVVVVTGAYAAEVQAGLAGLPVLIARNPDWQDGQSTSLAAGLRRLPTETGAAIFLLADQPQVTVPLLRSLAETHRTSLAPIVAPLVDGRRSNPVLFDRQTFPHLLALTGDTGGRALFSRFSPVWLPWHDARLALDVDTEEDYRRLLES